MDVLYGDGGCGLTGAAVFTAWTGRVCGLHSQALTEGQGSSLGKQERLGEGPRPSEKNGTTNILHELHCRVQTDECISNELIKHVREEDCFSTELVSRSLTVKYTELKL